MTTLIHADTSTVSVTIDQSAHEQRDKLLRGADRVTQVTNPAEQEVAVALARDMRRLLNDVESSRTAVKAPVLALGRTIDQTAKDFTTDIVERMKVLGWLVQQFQEQEQIRVKAEEAARAEAIRLAELDRNAREEEARAAAKQMTSEADLAAAIAAEAQAKAAEDQLRATIVAPLPEVNREAGTVLRWVPEITIVDIHEVYRARPDLVRLELNRSQFNSTVVRGVTVPGLKIVWEQKASFRT